MNFQIQHLATLAKYSGISFVAGAVNHGFFSEERSVWTAAVGVLCFLVGGVLDMRSSSSSDKSWGDLLGFGIVSSVGLGFFTGGLQHFPDSPDRSAWVVPLGFFLSVLAMWFTQGKGQVSMRQWATYTLLVGGVVVAGSLATRSYLQAQLVGQGEGHGHAHAHDLTAAPMSAAAEPAAGATTTGSVRSVLIELDDSMRINPQQWQATQGEALRLVVVNNGKVKHELVLGTPDELAAHVAEMRAAALATAAKRPAKGHHHGHNAVSVEPGAAAVLLWTFDQAGVFGMACFEPGHYEAGMKGVVQVAPKL